MYIPRIWPSTDFLRNRPLWYPSLKTTFCSSLLYFTVYSQGEYYAIKNSNRIYCFFFCTPQRLMGKYAITLSPHGPTHWPRCYKRICNLWGKKSVFPSPSYPFHHPRNNVAFFSSSSDSWCYLIPWIGPWGARQPVSVLDLSWHQIYYTITFPRWTAQVKVNALLWKLRTSQWSSHLMWTTV